MALCWQPASVTPAKQPKPSEVTTQPGERSALAQPTIALRVKPGTGAILIYRGRPSALSEMAATNGTLFSEPRPALPPANSHQVGALEQGACNQGCLQSAALALEGLMLPALEQVVIRVTASRATEALRPT